MALLVDKESIIQAMQELSEEHQMNEKDEEGKCIACDIRRLCQEEDLEEEGVRRILAAMILVHLSPGLSMLCITNGEIKRVAELQMTCIALGYKLGKKASLAEMTSLLIKKD